MVGTIIFILALLLLPAFILALFLVITYNRIVRLENEADRSWANIDVALKQRNDELPALVATVKGAATHEKELLERITKLRASIARRSGIAAKAAASSELSSALGSLFAVAENYPKLRANENFLALQKRISGIEDLIADRREHYNASTTLYNTRIAEFPINLVASLFKKTRRELFTASTGSVEVAF
jgi:LemA protein